MRIWKRTNWRAIPPSSFLVFPSLFFLPFSFSFSTQLPSVLRYHVPPISERICFLIGRSRTRSVRAQSWPLPPRICTLLGAQGKILDHEVYIVSNILFVLISECPPFAISPQVFARSNASDLFLPSFFPLSCRRRFVPPPPSPVKLSEPSH